MSPTQGRLHFAVLFGSGYRLPGRPAADGAMECDDRKARNASPDGEGNSRWRHFEIAAKWFPRTLKKDRDQAASRIIGLKSQSRVVARCTFATTQDGHLSCVGHLRVSQLGKLPKPEATRKIKHYYQDFKRRKSLLVDERDCYTEMVQAQRLAEEMGETEQYECCAQCGAYFEGVRGSPGDHGRWYCTKCWADSSSAKAAAYRKHAVANLPSMASSASFATASNEWPRNLSN